MSLGLITTAEGIHNVFSIRKLKINLFRLNYIDRSLSIHSINKKAVVAKNFKNKRESK